jgi:hypothetical protein
MQDWQDRFDRMAQQTEDVVEERLQPAVNGFAARLESFTHATQRASERLAGCAAAKCRSVVASLQPRRRA